jgi:hypothetical protein
MQFRSTPSMTSKLIVDRSPRRLEKRGLVQVVPLQAHLAIVDATAWCQLPLKLGSFGQLDFLASVSPRCHDVSPVHPVPTHEQMYRVSSIGSDPGLSQGLGWNGTWNGYDVKRLTRTGAEQPANIHTEAPLRQFHL